MKKGMEKNDGNMASVEIRTMEIDDIPAVYHLGESLFTSGNFPNLYRTWDEYEVMNIFQDDPQVCIVAETGGHIVGFALGCIYEKPRSAWKYGQLAWLGVSPPYQGSKLADRLFNTFRDLMIKTGVRILLVDTEADNERSIRFFESKGFGNPESHIYLYLNLDTLVKERKQKQASQKR